MTKRVLLSRYFDESLLQVDNGNKKCRLEEEDISKIICPEKIKLDGLVLQQCIADISYLDKISFERINFHLASIIRSTYKKESISLTISSECLPPEDALLIQKVFGVTLDIDLGSHKLRDGRLPRKNITEVSEYRSPSCKREIRISNDKLKMALTAIWSRFRRWLYLGIESDNSYNTTGQILNVLRKSCCRPLSLQKFELSAKRRPDFRLLRRFSPIIKEVILPDPVRSCLTRCLVGVKWRNLKSGAKRFDRAICWTTNDTTAMWTSIAQCENLRKIIYRGPSYSILSNEWRTNITERLKTITCFKINDDVTSFNLKQWFIDNVNIRALFFGHKCVMSVLLQTLLSPYLNPLLKRLRTIGLFFSTSDDPQRFEQDIFAVMLLISENAYPTVRQIVSGHDDLIKALQFWSNLSKKSHRWVKLKLIIKKEDVIIQEADNLNNYLASFSGDLVHLIKPISTNYRPFSSFVRAQLFISPLGYPTDHIISSK